MAPFCEILLMSFERRPLLGLGYLYDRCDVCWGAGCGVQAVKDFINEAARQRYEVK